MQILLQKRPLKHRRLNGLKKNDMKESLHCNFDAPSYDTWGRGRKSVKNIMYF